MDQIIPAPAPTRTEMGDLSSLTTTQKGSIVGAINEVDADVSTLNSKFSTVTGTHTFSCGAQAFSDAGAETFTCPTGYTAGNIIAIEAHVTGAYWARVVASLANNNGAVAFTVWNNTALTDATISFKITFMK